MAKPFFLILAMIAATVYAEGPAIHVETLSKTDAVHPGSQGRLAVKVTLGAGWHVNAHKPSDAYLIPTTLKLKPAPGLTIGEIVYPKPGSIVLEGSPQSLAVYSGAFLIGVAVDIGGTVKQGDYDLQGTLEYQACDSKRCLPPNTMPVKIPLKVVPANQPLVAQHAAAFASIRFGQAQNPPEAAPQPSARTALPEGGPVGTANWQTLVGGFTVLGTTTGYLKPAEFISFLDNVEAGRAQHAANPLANKNLLLAVLFVITGGILLNLTPCVLPLIPINLAIIGAGAKAGSKKRGFALGAAYGVGIALSYGMLGIVVVLGISSTFGTLNSTPWFNAGIAVLFLLLSLAMFDVFVIDFSRFQTRFNLQNKEGGSLGVAFAMGIVAALLAGACVAPVVIATILYAQYQYAKGHWVALFLPFLLGLGMALPWPVAGAGLSFLPKPGKWMERVKYAIAVFILGFAGYYGFEAWTLFSNQYLVDKQAVQSSAQALDKEGWTSDLAAGLTEAQRTGKPVIIDFWATWCKNCLAMNETTFQNEDIVRRLGKYVKIKFQAENPRDPVTHDILDHFGVIGLPTYVVLAPGRK